MGGLVARSACHYAALAGHAWLTRLDDLVFLGTPHFGAPLERAGAWVDYLVGISPYTAPFARLGKARSAGIKDLRHGDMRDEDWQSRRRAARARGRVRSSASARASAVSRSPASRQERPGAPASRIRGDGLVPVASALGRHADRARAASASPTRTAGSCTGPVTSTCSTARGLPRLRGWLKRLPAPDATRSRAGGGAARGRSRPGRPQRRPSLWRCCNAFAAGFAALHSHARANRPIMRAFPAVGRGQLPAGFERASGQDAAAGARAATSAARSRIP